MFAVYAAWREPEYNVTGNTGALMLALQGRSRQKITNPAILIPEMVGTKCSY